MYATDENGGGRLADQQAPAPRALPAPLRALGYASGPGHGRAATRELQAQAEVIAQDCDARGFELLEVVHEREPASGKAVSRPGLTYALERIARGEAGALVVSELSRITR